MAQTIKLKRSAVSGNTPSTSDLELGEIAINTYDGKVFIKKDDGSASVIEVGAADNTKLPLAGGTMTGALNMGGNDITSSSNLTLDVATNINLDAGTNGSVYLKDDGLTYGRLYRSGTPNHFNIKSTVDNADIRLQGKDNSGAEITALTLDMSDAGAAIFNGHGTFNDTVTINSTSTGAVTVSGSGGGINLTGGNNRIYFGGQRAMEGITSNGNIQIGEGFAGNLLLQMHTEVQGNLSLGDNRNLRIGSGPDLQLYHDGTNSYIKNDTGDLIVDAANDIVLDADGADILLKDGGTEFGRFSRVTSDFVIKSATSDKDIVFKGVDGGSTITALTLDMSEGGNATFANNVTISGNLEVTGTTTQTGSIITNSNFTGLSDANSANATDFGFYGKYVESSTTKYAGMYYDASTDNTFKLFCDTQTAPTTTVNESATGYALANLNIAGLTTTGNVGIGISAPTYPLAIQSDSSAFGINIIGRSSDSISQLDFDESDGTIIAGFQARTTDFRIRTVQNLPLLFMTNNTERVRLDSSGNLLVGTTSQISSGKISVAGGGSANGITATTAATSGFAAASFQRTTSDGQLIQFKKGSSEVGSILSRSGAVTTIILDPRTNGSGISGTTKGILPTNQAGTVTHNYVDLGSSTNNFKDLHLSGSANIGTNILMSNASTSGFMQVSTNILQFGTSSNDPLAIFTNNSEQIRIDTDGRLLLNTTASIDNLSQLHIVGYTSGRAGITLQDGDSTTQKTFFTQSAGTTRFNTQNDSSYGSFVIGGWNGTTSADFVRVDSSGRVGIGTTSPSQKLDVQGTILVNNEIQFINSTTRIFRSSNDLRFRTGSSDRMTVTSTGRVGIGTTAPTSTLEVAGTVRTDLIQTRDLSTMTFIDLDMDTGGTVGSNNMVLGAVSNMEFLVDTNNNGTSGAFIFKRDSNVPSSATEIMRLTEPGNLGIGTAAPAATLHVVGPAARPTDLASVDTASTAQFQADASNAHSLYIAENASGALIQVNDGATNSTAAKPLALQPFGGNVGIGTGTTAPSANLEVQDSSGSMIMVDDTNGRFIKIRSANSGSQNANISSYAGLYLGGSDNASHMVVANSGNVGIGTTNPSSRLTVEGDIRQTTGDLLYTGGGNYNIRHLIDDQNITFDTSTGGTTSEKMRVTAAGNVGIGTTSPQSLLHVSHATAPTFRLSRTGTGQIYHLTIDSSGRLHIQEAASEGGTKNTRFKIDDTGEITFNEAYTFPTADGSNGQALITDGSGNITFGSVSAGAASSMVDADGDTKIQVEEASDDDVIRFDTAGSQRMIINASGNVGINDNTPGKTLSVNGTFKSTGEAFFSHFDNMTSSSRMRDNLRLNFGTARTFAILGNSTNMHIRNSSTDVMTFDTSNRVGIGTTSPAEKLHVDGNVRLSGSIVDSFGEQLNFQSNDLVQFGKHIRAEYGLWARSATARAMGIDGSNGYMGLYTNETEKVRIDSSGNVGIGITDPDQKLDVNGNIRIPNQGKIVFGSAGASPGDYLELNDVNSSGSLLKLVQDSTTKLVVQGVTGNVGIGTTSPASALSSSNVNLTMEDADGADIKFKHTGGMDLTVGVTNSNTGYIWTGGSYNILFGTAGTERMRIGPTGRIGINTSTLSADGLIIGTTNNNCELDLYNTGGSGTRWRFNSSAYGHLQIENKTDATIPFTIRDNGRVGIGTTSPGRQLTVEGTSDAYIKTDATNHTSWTIGSDTYGFLIYDDDVGGIDGYRIVVRQSSGNVGVGTTQPQAKFQVEEAGIETTTTSTTATTQVAIDSFQASAFRSAEFTIQVKNSTDSTYHLTKVLLIHDGTTPAITEYGTIFTGSAAEATFDADISSGNVRLLATPASTDSMTFKVVRHCITV